MVKIGRQGRWAAVERRRRSLVVKRRQKKHSLWLRCQKEEVTGPGVSVLVSWPGEQCASSSGTIAAGVVAVGWRNLLELLQK
jgi:hypothetical protein